METDGSVSRWIPALRAGEKEAAHQLWEHFFNRMKQLARVQSKPSVTRGSYDEEDVAISAFATFCHALKEGSYPDLRDRGELWQLLATFTFRKARERAHAAQALKRGGRKKTETNGEPNRSAEPPLAVDELPSQAPTPDLLALMNEQCLYLFRLLQDPELEAVAVWKLEGYTNDEIAEHLGYTRRTVQRMLALIRQVWKQAPR
jgi:DNA-directed RNA polymerase specialized sigma24 family protein